MPSFTPARKPPFFYGWFVLAAAFVIVSIGYSMRFSFSVFYVEILNEFGWSRADTAAAFSINLLVYGISSPFVGTMTDRFGPRRVLFFGASILAVGLLSMSQMNNIGLFYFLLGVVMAVGINSLGFAVHSAYLPNWFVRRRGLAFGIMVAGNGWGLVLVSFYQSLISSLGWRTAYAVLSAITIGVVVPLVIFIIRGKPQDKGQQADNTLNVKESSSAKERSADLPIINREWAATEWTLSRAVKTRRLWFMFLNFVSFSIAMNLILAHQPIHSQDIGFSAAFAAWIFGLAGFVTMVGNFFGFVSDRIGREASYTLGMLGAIVAVSALMLAGPTQPGLLYLYAILWGLAFGIGSAATFPSLADLFAGKNFGSISGFCIMGFGIGGAIGPWLGGYIFDVTGSYTAAFITAMTALALSSVFIWLAAPRKIRLVPGKTLKVAN